MAIRRSSRRVGARRLAALAADLLEASTLCSIATADVRGRPHVSTAYFAWSPDLELVWLSDRTAKHSKNLAANPFAAIAVYASDQVLGGADRGIQLFGTARLADADIARRLYTQRFPAFGNSGSLRFYVFHADRLKLFDETRLGSGTFVTARVSRDRRPSWLRTEVYT